MEIRPVGAELLHAHRWTEGQMAGEANSRFSQFCQQAQKMVMNFQKVSGLEIKAFTGLKSEKPKNTEMRCWAQLELGAINLLW